MQTKYESCVSTPLLVEVSLPNVGEALQACFDIDQAHQADVFAAIEALLEKAASFCGGKLSRDHAALKELDKLRETTARDLVFLHDQFKLLDEWKAKAHEAGVTLGKMRTTYAKEVAMLREQIQRGRQKGFDATEQWTAPEALVFDAEDFLLANEVSKLISESQLESCKAKMVAMQQTEVQNQYLIRCMTKELGFEDEEQALSSFGNYDVNQQQLEQGIEFQLQQFKHDAERRVKLKRLQCQMESVPAQSKNPVRRRMSAPNVRQVEMHQERRKSDPAIQGLKPNHFAKWNLDPESESDASSDEDGDGVKGLKARFEERLRGRDKFEGSKTIDKAKERFLQSIGKSKMFPNLKKRLAAAAAAAAAKNQQDQSVQTDADTEETSSDVPEVKHHVRVKDQGVGTDAPVMQDRGINPIPLDAFLSGALLDDADMSALSTEDGAMLRTKHKATNLPRCAGATQDPKSTKVSEILASQRPEGAAAAPSSTRDKEKGTNKLSELITNAYASPFAVAHPEVTAPTSQRDRVASQLEPIVLRDPKTKSLTDAEFPEVDQAFLKEVTPETPKTPLSPSSPSSKRNPRSKRVVTHNKAKFASQS